MQVLRLTDATKTVPMRELLENKRRIDPAERHVERLWLITPDATSSAGWRKSETLAEPA